MTCRRNRFLFHLSHKAFATLKELVARVPAIMSRRREADFRSLFRGPEVTMFHLRSTSDMVNRGDSACQVCTARCTSTTPWRSGRSGWCAVTERSASFQRFELPATKLPRAGHAAVGQEQPSRTLRSRPAGQRDPVLPYRSRARICSAAGSKPPQGAASMRKALRCSFPSLMLITAWCVEAFGSVGGRVRW